MKLTNPEKLILVMLAEIQEKLAMKDGTDHKLVANAIYSENTWALDWEMPGIVGSSAEPTPPEVSFVVDVLDMWTFIEEAYESFNAVEKEKIKEEASPFGAHVHFAGFDGNNEGEAMSIANFLIEDMGRFSQFKGREMNSHCSSVPTYKKMLTAFEPLRSTLDGRAHLSVDQVVSILKAR
jgi:uncharacterized protein YfbU (UPF0304 family)